jgi:hypothetical protein
MFDSTTMPADIDPESIEALALHASGKVDISTRQFG